MTTRRPLLTHRPLLLTAREVAEVLRVDPRTLRRWVRTGKVPAPIQVAGSAGHTRFRRDDIEAVLARRPITQGAPGEQGPAPS